jgi:hypothetical protein
MTFFERRKNNISVCSTTGCWLWSGLLNNKGYGKVWHDGKMRQTHRIAFEEANGEGNADGLLVRHTCDVRACVNPAHLLSGTAADNSRDMVERGRHRAIALLGETNPSAKLTADDAVAIRAAYVPRKPGFSQHALARHYGVGQSTIGRILRNKNWVHV